MKAAPNQTLERLPGPDRLGRESAVNDRTEPLEVDEATKARFASKYRVDESGCWIWEAATHKSGYGQFGLRSGHVRAHRFSYELHVGPIPEGLVIDHLCKVRNCVNPSHLEAVTVTENTRRGSAWDFNRSKTHCPHVHEYTPENTFVMRQAKGGGPRRVCRTCDNAKSRAAYRKRKARLGLMDRADRSKCATCGRYVTQSIDTAKCSLGHDQALTASGRE